MQDRFNEKIFIGVSVILNLIILYFLLSNIIEYRELKIHNSNIKQGLFDIKNITINPNTINIAYLNQSFATYVNEISPKEGIANYAQLTSDLAQKYNIEIKNTKILNSNKNFIEIENIISGNPVSINSFISELEKNSPIRQIQKANIKFIDNKIELDLVVRNYIIK